MRYMLEACVVELERLRKLHLPQFEGKLGEPSGEVIHEARDLLATGEGEDQ